MECKSSDSHTLKWLQNAELSEEQDSKFCSLVNVLPAHALLSQASGKQASVGTFSPHKYTNLKMHNLNCSKIRPLLPWAGFPFAHYCALAWWFSSHWNVMVAVINVSFLRLFAFYSTCLPSLTNLYGEHSLTAFSILETFCVQIPYNESWLKWVRNSRLIMLFAPFLVVLFGFLLHCWAIRSCVGVRLSWWMLLSLCWEVFLGICCIRHGTQWFLSLAWPWNPHVWIRVRWQCMSKCSVFAFLI